MFAIIGIVVVFCAVLGGFLMEKGHIEVLIQPAELLIIAGAAAGTLLAANPTHILKAIAGGGGRRAARLAHDEGALPADAEDDVPASIEGSQRGTAEHRDDIEKPATSTYFKSNPEFFADRMALDFVCDTLRMGLTGGVEVFDMDQMLELDMEVHHKEAHSPVSALAAAADAMPAWVLWRRCWALSSRWASLGGPAEEIGKKVASALVGTFLGILLCYGVVGPLSAHMAKIAEEHDSYLHVLRVLLMAFMKGSAPLIAIETARRGDSGAGAAEL